MKERFGLIQFKGKPATVLGEDIGVGQIAPDFTLHGRDWSIGDEPDYNVVMDAAHAAL